MSRHLLDPGRPRAAVSDPPVSPPWASPIGAARRELLPQVPEQVQRGEVWNPYGTRQSHVGMSGRSRGSAGARDAKPVSGGFAVPAVGKTAVNKTAVGKTAVGKTAVGKTAVNKTAVRRKPRQSRCGPPAPGSRRR